MLQQTIYEVKVTYIGALNNLREREPFVSYFSNLKKTIENISAQLALNGWPLKLNYSAVYRSLHAKGKYSCDFDVAGYKVFKITITPQILNPTLSTLGIDEMPVPKPK
ncbi:hypothetical protein [Runella zeae]|uniref:hypothetical protein n=1 Tax=Runella zeae TaxID=94255 RepID=UPI00041983E4|nr:hypothetical protein [Runella zeae]